MQDKRTSAGAYLTRDIEHRDAVTIPSGRRARDINYQYSKALSAELKHLCLKDADVLRAKWNPAIVSAIINAMEATDGMTEEKVARFLGLTISKLRAKMQRGKTVQRW